MSYTTGLLLGASLHQGSQEPIGMIWAIVFLLGLGLIFWTIYKK